MLMAEHAAVLVPEVTEYFPELNGDLTHVVWAHAVNNRSLLTKALNDSSVMMLEADVVLGTIFGQNDIIPIMAHPPQNKSDLSLHMFLETVITSQTKDVKKGVKLDFKSTECFKTSLAVIEPLKVKVTFPFFLNADILLGPINSTLTPVDPEIFLKLSSTKFPESTLSIGWTTRYAPGMEGFYTKEQLNAMKQIIQKNEIIQTVTLCLRAGIAAQSDGIKDLLESIDNYQGKNKTSVTIWMSSDTDPVDVFKLKNLVLQLNKHRVYIDVPKFVREELALDSSNSSDTKR